ncbi:MAG: chromosome segregation protein SMC [Candidatus Nanopelagicales bacterium]|nr:chromosome segregation protein SMC [Candidatus Nanopelagicales bacterium]
MTLKGFKSFASSTTMHFEPGVTCVVGPNGSGKSNVVDALAWVMGEQGAKSLRGGKMEDVIFSGTAGRAPLGRAEVSLTIDNSDGALPIEYTEVTISRTLFRNGGSEYGINGQPCRLLDVQELLSDSGIGREMHVIVGQGQLDTILQATPEDRRGFIEEAAGVLKHRRRKEKALRKLDSMEANLTRLQDLTTELRRQLKPLGRQAEVARRAVVIQSDARDARLRIMADDLVQMRGALAAEVADESALRARQSEVDAVLQELRSTEAATEQESLDQAPRLQEAQDTWFALSGLRERFSGLVQLCAERVRNLQPEPHDDNPGRDPEQLEAEARTLRSQEFELGREVEAARDGLAGAVVARQAAEDAAAAEESRIGAAERTAAERREGLARLTGQVNAAQSRLEARTHELERLGEAIREATQRSEQAQAQFQAIEVQVAGLDAGEVGLDEQHERAEAALAAADAEVERLRGIEATSERERAALAARLDALAMSLLRKDAGGLLASDESPVAGVVGPLAAQLRIAHGAQAAVAAVLGDLADAVVVRGSQAAVSSVVLLKERDAGRAALVVMPDGPAEAPAGALAAPIGTWLADTVTCDPALAPVIARLLAGAVLVDGLEQAAAQAQAHPGLVFVTATGDVFTHDVVHGGSQSAPSMIEVQAAHDETETALQQVIHAAERARFDMIAARERQQAAAAAVEQTLSSLHESDARMAAVAEQLGQLGQVARAAGAEADRLTQSLAAAQVAHAADLEQLQALQVRLAEVHDQPEIDLSVELRDALADAARAARQHEVDARLSLRTGEERVAAVGIRAEQLERAAAAEREARVQAVQRRQQRARDLVTATAVLNGARASLARIEVSVAQAGHERTSAEQQRKERDERLVSVRTRIRALAAELDLLKDSVHRDEVARAEQRMRIEQVVDRALEEFGIDADVLVAEYGPDQLVPPSPNAPGDEVPDDAPEPLPYAFVRAEQERRLKEAERGLALLGRVNPLALEEFTAMEERHRFLSEQLDDLRRTRDDLLDIVKEVDARVEQVFTEAYAEIAREFEGVFSRLFPGGEGRLILTDPGNMLTTGVDVEARPPGKKVKRLSLLSGGERSLTAVAFLVALFKARPSPFYVLDEVEAALDDVNLGRLIDIIEELRDSSQLIVITHQKRTMEIADALYGVSMRGDGVTQVIGQRLREAATAS